MSDWSDISDPELRKWWEGAATKYYSEVKREPNTADAMSIDGLLASLYGDGVDDHHKGNQKKTRAYLNNILTTIQNMGAFVSSATSNAFQASDICLNAVCYLVKAAKDYHAYFASIGDLFEAILPFLMRFDVYARDKYKFVELDGHVKSIIFKLLKCFMEICNISSRITKEKASKWGKLRVAAKVLAYQDDGGVKDKLNKIQNLVSQELSMDVAVILKSVKLTENGVVELRTDMTKIKEDVGSVNSTVKSFDGRFTEAQKREEEERVKNTNRQTIMNVLDIKDGKRPWVDAQQKHLTNALQGTGAWLISDPDFQKWANAKGGTFSAVLAFRANAKCGKTYLCSQAIDRLQEICRNRADDAGSVQTHLAYYFIEEKDEDRMSKALRTIIWQLTESDIVFQKHVAAKCAGREYFPNLEDMWKSTMMTFKPVAQRREYIIVLDGIDNVVGSDQRHKKHPLSGRLNDIDLLKYQKVNLKFLITGKETILRGLEWESDAAFTYVDVVSKSEADIRRYIDNRLGAVSQDWSATGETQQLKKKVGETLLQASKGDYYKLDSLFNDISSQNDLDGIESVLKRAGESRKEATARHLRRLNKDLNDEDIKDFNEILPWVIFATGRVSLEHLEEVLLVRRKSRLLSLKKQLLNYAPLLEITNNGSVDYVESSLLKEYFSDGVEQEIRLVRDPIHPKEIAIVRRFLETVCDQELFDKFGFEDFFNNRSSFLKKTSISFDCVDGHMKIVLCCLQAFCGEYQTDDVFEILLYASQSLPWHFTQVSSEKLAQGDRGIMRKIGKLLHSLFTKESCFQSWACSPTIVHYITRHWVYEAAGAMSDIVRWFKDPALSEDLDENQKEEVGKLAYGAKNIADLFTPASLFMARESLFGSKLLPQNYFWWLQAYRSLTKDPKNIKKRHVVYVMDASSSQISDTEQWARNKLDLSAPDSSYALRLAKTYSILQHHQKAVELCRRGLTANPENWELSWCLVWSLERIGATQSAIKELRHLLKNFEASTAKQENRDAWYEMLYEMGTLLSANNQTDDAIALYKRLLHEFPNDGYAMAQLISHMKQKKDYRGIISLLQHTETDGQPALQRLLHVMFHDASVHRNLSVSFHRGGSLDLLWHSYSAASNHLTGDYVGLRRRSTLRYFHGLTLFYNGTSELDTLKAMELWKHNVFDAGKENLVSQDCANYLAGTYVELGRKAATENDGKALEKYVSELQELHDAIIKSGRITVNKKVILLLGRLYHLQARKEEAKKCFRDHVGTCLELLSDEDPSNDYQAYMGLGESLGRLYDDENALAAWSLIGPNNESTDGPVDRTEGATSEPSGPLYYRCANGECNHMWKFANDIYACRDCIGCMFCENCHTELKAGRMEWRVCGKDHEFLYVPKWDAEAAEKIGKGHVKVGNDSVMRIEDWLDKLRREYGIGVPKDGGEST